MERSRRTGARAGFSMIIFTPGQQGQVGYTPTIEGISSAVTANTDLLPDMFAPGMGAAGGSISPTDLASQGAQSVVPWMEKQRDAGIFQPTTNIGAPHGLESQFDLIGSMLSGGGGYEVDFQNESLNPEVAALLSGHDNLSSAYSDATQPSGSFTQKGLDELIEGLPESPSVNFEGDTDVLDVIKDNPNLMQFYDAVEKADPVQIQLDSADHSGALQNIPRQGLQDAIDKNYFENDPLYENLGGNYGEQLQFTEDLYGQLVDPMVAAMGDDWAGGITFDGQGGVNVPQGLIPTDVPSFQLPAMPEWAPGILTQSEWDSLGGQASGFAQGAGDALQDPGNQDITPLQDAMGYLQQHLPGTYTQ